MQCFANQLYQRSGLGNIYEYHMEHVNCGFSELCDTVWETLTQFCVNPEVNIDTRMLRITILSRDKVKHNFSYYLNNTTLRVDYLSVKHGNTHLVLDKA